MTYDKVEWHFSGDFPKELKFESAGIHIGMFLQWVIENNLIGNFHLKESLNSIDLVKNGKMDGLSFLIKECDSKLTDEDLNNEGNKFAYFYYANDNDYCDYIDNYAIVFKEYDSLYKVENNIKNYNLIKEVISEKYLFWKEK